MAFFSNEEFDKIFCEIVQAEPICYDALLCVSKRALVGYVRKWCNGDPVLCGRQYEDDIMQEIQMRLIKYCVTDFFLKNGRPNYDPVGFKNWMFTLAKNVLINFKNKMKRIGQFEISENEVEPGIPGDCDDTNDAHDRLAWAFKTVLESDSNVYKVLTWAAQYVIIATSNVSKIESNHILIERFNSMTLDAMLALIVEKCANISWMQLEAEQVLAIKAKLDEHDEEGRRIGDKCYGEFYMKKGPKASVSDWINRMNNYVIKEEKQNGTSHC